jgi:hypothetical protein
MNRSYDLACAFPIPPLPVRLYLSFKVSLFYSPFPFSKPLFIYRRYLFILVYWSTCTCHSLEFRGVYVHIFGLSFPNAPEMNELHCLPRTAADRLCISLAENACTRPLNMICTSIRECVIRGSPMVAKPECGVSRFATHGVYELNRLGFRSHVHFLP